MLFQLYAKCMQYSLPYVGHIRQHTGHVEELDKHNQSEI